MGYLPFPLLYLPQPGLALRTFRPLSREWQTGAYSSRCEPHPPRVMVVGIVYSSR